jgi:hypothetical protein
MFSDVSLEVTKDVACHYLIPLMIDVTLIDIDLLPCFLSLLLIQ